MARIKGIDIPDNKAIGYSLTYIYGIGRSTAKKICEDAKIEEGRRVKDLSEDELNKIRNEVSKYTIEGDLRRQVSTDIKTQKEIKSYRGIRHIKGLPCRGQKTGRNCRSWKNRRGSKKIVANKKK